MTDAELVERTRQGETAAFGELVERHRVAVYRAALAALASREDAEDVAQETFVTAFQKIRSFRGEASFKTWLLTIAWRQALDRRQSIRLRFRRFLSGEGVERIEVADPDARQDDRLIGAELRAEVRSLVRALPPRLRDPLLLWASGEVSYEEMSAALRVPVGTLKWRVMEAKRQLKMKLERGSAAALPLHEGSHGRK